MMKSNNPSPGRQPFSLQNSSFAVAGALALLAALVGHAALIQSCQAQAEESTATLDQAMSLLNQARLQFQSVQDYECRLIKRERIKGKLLPESVMTMKVRNHPFSICLHCASPEADRGLQVCFVEGRNKGMMRVQPAHIKGVLGFWSVNIRDVRAFEKNRHCITEAGLGNLLESTARYWDMEQRLNGTFVRIADDTLAGRACTRIETIHPDRTAGSFYGYRCVLWLDKETHLPAGAETYDWPQAGGQGAGDLLEAYRFENLRCNIGLSDKTFDH
jgi:hypothetical protein